MCGRFEIHSAVEIIAKIFGTPDGDLEYPPRYNIAPSQDILIVMHDGKRKLVKSCWGFVPSWARDLDAGHRMINARAETVATNKTFKSAFEKQRCLVVADGFYEWRKEGTTKKPFYIRLASRKPFGFAGLYTIVMSPNRAPLMTSTIMTIQANELIMPMHDRMPVIIPPDTYDLWLDPTVRDSSAFPGMLHPYPSGEMECFPVTPRMNSVRYDAPENIQPLEGWNQNSDHVF